MGDVGPSMPRVVNTFLLFFLNKIEKFYFISKILYSTLIQDGNKFQSKEIIIDFKRALNKIARFNMLNQILEGFDDPSDTGMVWKKLPLYSEMIRMIAEQVVHWVLRKRNASFLKKVKKVPKHYFRNCSNCPKSSDSEIIGGLYFSVSLRNKYCFLTCLLIINIVILL